MVASGLKEGIEVSSVLGEDGADEYAVQLVRAQDALLLVRHPRCRLSFVCALRKVSYLIQAGSFVFAFGQGVSLSRLGSVTLQ